MDGVADNSAEVARKVRAEVLEKLKQRLKQKKTLPYWKYWKKTERLTKLPIKLPEKVRQFVIKLPEARQFMIILLENESKNLLSNHLSRLYLKTPTKRLTR